MPSLCRIDATEHLGFTAFAFSSKINFTLAVWIPIRGHHLIHALAAVARLSRQRAAFMRTLLIMRSPLLREALSRLLAGEGYTIIGETSKPEKLKDIQGGIAPEEADIIIIDGAIVAEDRAAIDRVRHRYPVAKMIVIGRERAEPVLSSASIASIDGVLSYQTSIQTLLQAIGLVVLGEKIIPPGLVKRLFQETAQLRTESTRPRDELDLSKRERQILEALLRGSSNKMIARQLELSEATVKVHLRGLLQRLRASNRTQAAIWALTHGIGLQVSGNLNEESQSAAMLAWGAGTSSGAV